MSKGIRLSHSSIEKYLTCSMQWKLHYVDKLRSKTFGSPLMFGTAIDAAVETLLLDKKKNLTEEEKHTKTLCPFEVFDNYMISGKINNKEIFYPISTQLDYFKSDCNLSLLNDKIQKNIKEIVNIEIKDITEFVKYVQKNEKSLDQEEKLAYNYICWSSLREKGHLLISAFKNNVMPQIHEVFGIQKKIELHDHQDLLVGYIDFIASFVDSPGVKFVCDLKTSSRAYSKDSVKESQQLAIYCEHERIFNAAYIVLEKKIRKKEPKVRTQIIKGKIKEKLLTSTFERVGDVLENIREKKFEKNFDACFQYGRMCPYFQLCKYNKKSDDLEDMKNDKS